MSVYLRKYPNESAALLKYVEIVRGIAKQGGDFCFYDESFRAMRQKTPVSWGCFSSELYVHALQTKLHSNPSSMSSGSYVKSRPRQTSDGYTVPPGFCFTFHQGAYCPGCSYSHKCPKCGGLHQAMKCSFRSFGKGRQVFVAAVASGLTILCNALREIMTSDTHILIFLIYKSMADRGRPARTGRARPDTHNTSVCCFFCAATSPWRLSVSVRRWRRGS